MAKQLSTILRRAIKQECAASTVFLTVEKETVELRSVNGIQRFGMDLEQRDIIIELVGKIKHSKLIRTILCLSFLLLSITVYCQVNDPYNVWNFSYGRTGTPGDQLKVGLEYARTAKGSIYGETGYEFSKHSGIKYSSISVGLGARYYLLGNNYMSAKRKINIAAGLGGVAQYESEPSVYKGLSFSSRLNYGVSGSLLAEYFYDPTIGLFIAGEQKVLFKELLGKYNYGISVGLRIHFISVQ